MTSKQFKQECENLPVTETYNVGAWWTGRTRTIYTPLHGIVIVEEDMIPHNPFQKSRYFGAWIDIAVFQELATRIAEQYNGTVRECPYCQEDDPRFYVEFVNFKTAAQFIYDQTFNGLWKEVGSCETTESMS